MWWTLVHSTHRVFSMFPHPMLPSWSTYYPYELLGHLETGWDLEHRTFCSSACIWTDISSSNKIERNYKAQKITACSCNQANSGQLDTKKKKKGRKKKTHAKKPAATFEVLGAKEGYRTQPLHTTLPKGGPTI